MNELELSLGLMLLLFAILGSGVWIALALAVCGFAAVLDKGSNPSRTGAGNFDVDCVEFVGSHGVADVYLDGGRFFIAPNYRTICSKDWRRGCRNCRAAFCT